MSHHNDLIKTFREAKVDYNLSEEQCIDFYLEVMRDIGFSTLSEKQYLCDEWRLLERIEARNTLFGGK